MAMVAATTTGQERLPNQEDRVRANHDQLAVSEVDEAHDPEDEGNPERVESELRSVGDGVDDVLEEGATSRRPGTWFRSPPCADLVSRACVGDTPTAEDVCTVGELDRAGGVLLDQQDCDAFAAQLLEGVEDDVDHDRREPQRRLIE